MLLRIKNVAKNDVTQKSPSTEFLLEGDLPPWDFKRLATMKHLSGVRENYFLVYTDNLSVNQNK